MVVIITLNRIKEGTEDLLLFIPRKGEPEYLLSEICREFRKKVEDIKNF